MGSERQAGLGLIGAIRWISDTNVPLVFVCCHVACVCVCFHDSTTEVNATHVPSLKLR